MEYPLAIRRLSNHANMPGSDLPETESLVFALNNVSRQKAQPRLDEMLEDIIACLNVINRNLNGLRPSEVRDSTESKVPRTVCASVATILSAGWSHHYRWTERKTFSFQFRSELAVALIKIGIAWDAVLAGDIDDISDQVRVEYSARFDGF